MGPDFLATPFFQRKNLATPQCGFSNTGEFLLLFGLIIPWGPHLGQPTYPILYWPKQFRFAVVIVAAVVVIVAAAAAAVETVVVMLLQVCIPTAVVLSSLASCACHTDFFPSQQQ